MPCPKETVLKKLRVTQGADRETDGADMRDHIGTI